MGMSSSQCRLLQLTSRLSDLEQQAQCVSNSKIRNSVKSEQLAVAYTTVLADTASTDDQITAATATYEASTGVLEAQDKLYDMDLENLDTEHTAAQTEVDSVRKVINKNIERTFKIFDA
jgi:hypothetical protein